MGQSTSCPKDAPLSLILRDWTQIPGTVGLSKTRMGTLSKVVWPSLTSYLSEKELDWPECGTFNAQRMNALRDILVDQRPAQMDYLFVWYNYVPKDGHKAIQAVCLSGQRHGHPPPYGNEEEEDPYRPSLYPFHLLAPGGQNGASAPVAPTVQQGQAGGSVGRVDTQAKRMMLPQVNLASPVLRGQSTGKISPEGLWGESPDKIIHALDLATPTSTFHLHPPDTTLMETSPINETDLAVAKSVGKMAKLYANAQSQGKIPELVDWTIATPSHPNRRFSKFNPTSSTPGQDLQAPLRAYPVPTQGGHEMVFAHLPFSTNDLLNFQQSMPRLRDSPDVVYQRFKTIFTSYAPNWNDIGQLLDCLLTEDERQKVKTKAMEYIRGKPASNTWVLTEWPVTNPHWDANNDQGKLALANFVESVLEGIKAAGEVTPNWSKITACVQREGEHPSDFCTRLTSEFRKHGALDPESVQGQEVLKTVYMSQCWDDIAKRFREHPDGMQGKNLAEIVSIATRVFNAREEKKEKQKRKEKLNDMREQVSLMAAMVTAGQGGRGKQSTRGNGRGRGRQMRGGMGRGNFMNMTGGNRCFACQQEGHLKRDCPLLVGNKRTPQAGQFAEFSE